MATRRFLYLSDAGGDNLSGTVRSSCNPVGSVEWSASLGRGKRLAKPTRRRRAAKVLTGAECEAMIRKV